LLVRKFFKYKYFLSSLILLSTYVFAATDQSKETTKDLPRNEIFPPADGKIPPLQGKITEARYHAPRDVFSCQAYDFGEGNYTAQDGLLEQAACVGFYNALSDFKKAEILFFPGLEKKTWGEKELKGAFERFGIGILKSVDTAQGINVLKEEMLGDNMFFAAISVEKMSVLKSPNGQHVPSTRGYLIFQDKDKLAVLSNQLVTLPGQRHEPKKHVERLKREILEFRKTFEFGAIPESVIEKIKSEASS
jgi:hypothetical protein